MGANYMSLQIPDTTAVQVHEALQAFNATGGAGLAAYLGPSLGRWTAVYPAMSEEMDKFAKYLSGATRGIVLALGSFDEDEFYCNVCNLGKDLGYFKISTGEHRKGKKRESVVKRLDMLTSFYDAPSRAALLERLCDTRKDTWSTDILNDFCKSLGIRNARCSFTYIEKGGYHGDLDEVVPMIAVKR